MTDGNDPDYQQLPQAIQTGKSIIDAEPRFATAEFKPNEQDIRELKKYGVLPETFTLAEQMIDSYEADQKYWKSLWSPVCDSRQAVCA